MSIFRKIIPKKVRCRGCVWLREPSNKCIYAPYCSNPEVWQREVDYMRLRRCRRFTPLTTSATKDTEKFLARIDKEADDES